MENKGKVREHGITLVALIITIIILLILAGVAITALTQTGIIGYAKKAKDNMKNAQIEENVILGSYENKIDEISGGISGSRDTVTISKEEYENLKNANNYSNEETKVGTWINGKTIYRKITYFNCSIKELNGASTGIKNGGILIRSDLYGTEAYGWKWLMDGTNRATWLDNTLSNIYTNNNYDGIVVYGIFEYTKTTD